MNKLAIYEQLSLEIKSDIASGILRSGDKLPSVRKFALEKKINPNTAAKVYKFLENEGVITSDRKSTRLKSSHNRQSRIT